MKQLTDIEEFNYNLPAEKIALFPCEKRDESKLLIYKDKTIKQDIFKNINNYLSDNYILIFNNTKVVQARIIFQKAEGATIEIFCLEPMSPTSIHSLAFEITEKCQWLCYIGNNKKMKSNLQLSFNYCGETATLTAKRIEKKGDAFLVEFSWTPTHLTFSEVLQQVGKIPLPPYIKRPAEKSDNTRYQTVFAQNKGSVAAPTAGLHFTEELLSSIVQRGIPILNITLHVGAGTFKPVTEQHIENHTMHTEQIFFGKSCIIELLENINKQIIAIGTTTTRSLESLYWIGVKINMLRNQQQKITNKDLHLSQWEIYETLHAHSITKKEALENIVQYLNEEQSDTLCTSTAIMITPYYQPKIVSGLITNFHQPKSTLLLLVSAFIGQEWKSVYNYALKENFRFLSYGDACLFLI